MRAVFAWPLMMLMALPAWADARMSVLVDVLQLEAAAQILRVEGLEHAANLNTEMLDGKGGAGWEVQVGAIFDTARMVETVRLALEAELDADAREEVIAFFGAPAGTRIIELENEARAAIIAPKVEKAARARYAQLDADADPRLDLISQIIEPADMTTRNVTSALNANFQFLRGLADGGGSNMSEEEMLAQVSGDLEEVTNDTGVWLYSYMLLAYHPLDDTELLAYIAFSNTPAGVALNRALFVGFGAAYEDISYALGRVVALNMTAEAL
ncbi:hypothetical protein SAMN04488523_11856 [Sulfitobacter brevis]|uniref:DUF2059 domain-containing protein n=1 Tax=Sulfitobacter brevis TaxID=74348 RepID=A0A1I2G1W3_9RHOB|nr:DUF2059 domain-containing protein [Sulfitobacter brevis]SFF10631.1 hypothetical protein SAMN04488523_11856 [Sulfitobacter brevis]